MAATTQDRRRIRASMGVVWTYFVALSEGDFAAGSSALTFFQRTWPSTRVAIVAYNPGYEDVIPRALPVSGAWTNDTRLAVSSLLVTNFGSDVFNSPRIDAVPTTAGGIASWFNNNFEPFASAEASQDEFNVWWEFESLLDGGAAGFNIGLQSLTDQVLSGVTFGEPDVVATGSEPARDVIERTSTDTAVADAIDAAATGAGDSYTDPGGGTTIDTFDPLLVTGRRPPPPSPWRYLVVAVGAVGFGALAYYFWAYRQRRAG